MSRYSRSQEQFRLFYRSIQCSIRLTACAIIIGLMPTGRPHVSFAQNSEPLPPTSVAPDFEQMLPERPVSGEMRVGVMTNVNTPASYEEVTVMLPQETPGSTLCLLVTSNDGRYSATLSYDIPDVPGPQVLLSFPTRHLDDLTETYAPSELALLVRIGSTCDPVPGPAFVPASWSDTAISDSIRVYVNFGVPTEIVGGEERRIDHVAPCVDLNGPNIAFNKRCDLAREWLTPDSDFFIRIRSGPRYRYIPMKILAP